MDAVNAKPAVPVVPSDAWTTDDAKELYLIDRWGSGYFDVRADGNITVAPLQERGQKISIHEVVAAGQEQGLQTPLLIRFQDLLHHRVRALNEAFNSAIAENKFRGTYRGVFPIKVNQLREVVEEILEAGRPFHYGLEAGSKPEIFAGLSRAHRQRVAHRLQRLQGRRLHPHRDDRAQAGQEGRSSSSRSSPRCAPSSASPRRWASSR